MSVPEKPYTRKEAYLNAAATGDTSGIPETPYTREEMYLEAIAKNGGGGGGGGSSSLSGLTDVDISNPTDGQTLVYDATAEKWVNGRVGGGIIVTAVPTEDPEVERLSHTWQEIVDNGFACYKNWAAGGVDERYMYDMSQLVCYGYGDPENEWGENRYYLVFSGGVGASITVFTCSNASDYPIL